MAQHTKPCSHVEAVAVAAGEAIGRIGAGETARNSSGAGSACEVGFVSTSGAGLAAAFVDLDHSNAISADVELAIVAEHSRSGDASVSPVEQHTTGEIFIKDQKVVGADCEDRPFLGEGDLVC